MHIFLPRDLSDDEAPSTTRSPASAVRAGTVLLVEDDAMVRTFTTKALARLGFIVHVAEDLPGAQRASEQHGEAIDLLIADVIMPRASGPDVDQALRRQLPGLHGDLVLPDRVDRHRPDPPDSRRCPVVGGLGLPGKLASPDANPSG